MIEMQGGVFGAHATSEALLSVLGGLTPRPHPAKIGTGVY
jgi:hypothetical protein